MSFFSSPSVISAFVFQSFGREEVLSEIFHQQLPPLTRLSSRHSAGLRMAAAATSYDRRPRPG